MADILYALGQMGVSLSDLSPDHQQRLKASICRYLPRAAQRGRAWRGLYGLSQMGVRWQHANVKLRNALEGCLQQYALVPNWAYSPKELAVVLHSLHAMVPTTISVDTTRSQLFLSFTHPIHLKSTFLPCHSYRVCHGPPYPWTLVSLSLLL